MIDQPKILKNFFLENVKNLHLTEDAHYFAFN